MRFVIFRNGPASRLGVLDPEQSAVLLVEGRGDEDPSRQLLDVVTGMSGPESVSPPLVGPALPLHDLELLAPLPYGERNIFCVGKNYREHAVEFEASGFDTTSGTGPPAALEPPIIFTKPRSCVIGPGASIDPHSHLTGALDYEAEVAVIIGREGRTISRAAAIDHVWGYTIINDVTARDLQRDHKQWFLGKALDTFCPLGPVAVTADEVDPDNLQLQCWVNGELRQKASTRDLIFDIPTLISEISKGIRLLPGDVISTGTPAGVGVGFDPPRWLRAGDEITISVTSLGTLTNTVGPSGTGPGAFPD